MTATAIVCLPICFTGNQIARWEVSLFFGCYAYLIPRGQCAGLSRAFGTVMVVFVLSLTVLTALMAVVSMYRLEDAVMPDKPCEGIHGLGGVRVSYE